MGIFLQESAVVARIRRVEYLAIVVHAFIRHVDPKLVALGRQADVLCRVPTDAVHAARLEFGDICLDDVLHGSVLSLEVPHAYFAVSDLPAVAIVDAARIVVVEVCILEAVSHISQVAVGMVCHNVDNDLHPILVSLRTKGGQ